MKKYTVHIKGNDIFETITCVEAEDIIEAASKAQTQCMKLQNLTIEFLEVTAIIAR